MDELHQSLLLHNALPLSANNWGGMIGDTIVHLDTNPNCDA
jgi:hypothetical protein